MVVEGEEKSRVYKVQCGLDSKQHGGYGQGLEAGRDTSLVLSVLSQVWARGRIFTTLRSRIR